MLAPVATSPTPMNWADPAKTNADNPAPAPVEKPLLPIQPGDTVQYRRLDSGWGLEPRLGGEYKPRREFEGRDKELDTGHALIGPIAIEGAQPGMTLQIDIKAVQPGPWGACYSG